MSGMGRILLSGSTGFIGSNLARYWQRKHEIWYILRKSSLRDDRLFDVPIKNVIYWEDIVRKEMSFSSLPDFSCCYHLAVAGNSPAIQNVMDMISGNISLLIQLMDFCTMIKVKKLIHFASWSEYGDHGNIPLKEELSLVPDYLYGASKTASYILGRAYAQKIKLPFLTLRLFSLFGRYDKPYNLIPSLMKACLFHKEIHLTQGGQKRDFLPLEELFSLLDIIQEDKESISDVFNVCSGKATTLKEIGEIIQNFSGNNQSFFKWGEKPYRPNEAMYIVGDPTKTYKQFGWKAEVDLKTSLQSLFDWYEANLEWLES
jgi:nucleoside-diphosphate-sugar epimerase